MNINDAISQRHSTRAFLDKNVSREQVNRILDIARHAPSGANTQPWRVAVVSGKSKNTLQKKIEHAFNSGVDAQISYQYYPITWKPIYKSRRKECGLQLYSSLNIAKNDREKRQAQWAANYRAFDAPVMLLFFIAPEMETGSFLDYGIFLQSVMLAAMEEGLATCPQAALAEYPQIAKQSLGYTNDDILICGMALGYEDTHAPVNNYRTARESASSFSDYFN
ncbi:MAG: nitroreductase [Piscirickettsiaceae bacterium]|nr:nitroreductase [Piscirickettsiaceae bacterium]